MTVYDTLMAPYAIYHVTPAEPEQYDYIEEDPVHREFPGWDALRRKYEEKPGVWSLHDLTSEYGVVQVFRLADEDFPRESARRLAEEVMDQHPHEHDLTTLASDVLEFEG